MGISSFCSKAITFKESLANGLADVIENDANGEDKFIASLILAKEIAGRMNGRAVLRYD